MNLNADSVIKNQFVPATNESELIYEFSYPPNEELFWSLPFSGTFYTATAFIILSTNITLFFGVSLNNKYAISDSI